MSVILLTLYIYSSLTSLICLSLNAISYTLYRFYADLFCAFAVMLGSHNMAQSLGTIHASDMGL